MALVLAVGEQLSLASRSAAHGWIWRTKVSDIGRPEGSMSEDRRRAHEAFSAALDTLEAAKREPDRREEECLALAMAAMACGLYDAAFYEIDAFATAKSGQSQFAAARSEPPRFTVARLRRALDQMLRFDG
jgi:hypothetical protein